MIVAWGGLHLIKQIEGCVLSQLGGLDNGLSLFETLSESANTEGEGLIKFGCNENAK